jgi:hypothetical protein
MKRITLTFALLFIFLTSIAWTANLEDQDAWNKIIAKTNWKLFSKNLVQAIKSDNLGLKVSAMQKVIKYKEKVDVEDAALEVVRLYRRHKDDRVRQLALVTLHSMQNDWALGIVKRDYNFENNSKIKRLMAAIIVDQENTETSMESDQIISAYVEESLEQEFNNLR